MIGWRRRRPFHRSRSAASTSYLSVTSGPASILSMRTCPRHTPPSTTTSPRRRSKVSALISCYSRRNLGVFLDRLLLLGQNTLYSAVVLFACFHSVCLQVFKLIMLISIATTFYVHLRFVSLTMTMTMMTSSSSIAERPRCRVG